MIFFSAVVFFLVIVSIIRHQIALHHQMARIGELLNEESEQDG